MHYFDSQDLTPKQTYKFLTGSVIPRPIAWITTQNRQTGVVNAAPFSFFSVASNQLPLLTVSILRDQGRMKDTARNLLEEKNGVVHIVSEHLAEKMNRTSAPLEEDVSEVELAQLTTVPSEKVAAPGLKEALLRMEVSLYQYIVLKDEQEKPVTDLFVLKVEAFHLDESVFDAEKQYILPEKLNPVARLAGIDYASLGEIYSLVRPS